MGRKSILKTIGSFSLAAVLLFESATLVGAQSLADRLNYKDDSAVADILFDMDAEITALEHKLAKCQKLKQGMMQQLLTGKIRLI